jgi:hypothetical protein
VAIVLLLFVGAAVALVVYLIAHPKQPAKEAEKAEPIPDPTAGPCSGCGGALTSVGIERFRTGGTSGGWKLLAGEWAELGEKMLELEVLACPNCRRVAFRLPPA